MSDLPVKALMLSEDLSFAAWRVLRFAIGHGVVKTLKDVTGKNLKYIPECDEACIKELVSWACVSMDKLSTTKDAEPLDVRFDFDLRDYFAAKAIDVVTRDCLRITGEMNVDNIAHNAYQLADAMLKAREQCQS